MANTTGKKFGGRERGTPNKATMQAREAIAMFVEGNVDRLNGWLDEICEENGAMAAFDRFMAVVEYHVPKLQRTELAGDQKAPIVIDKPPSDAEALGVYLALLKSGK